LHDAILANLDIITKIGMTILQWGRYLIDTNHLLIRGMEMGRIDNIIQRHFDERIEQNQALLTERVEKLEKIVMKLKTELSEIRKKPPRKNEKDKVGLFSI